MRTVVYGAGGVGSFFGGLLARAGEDVCFIARGRQLDALNRDGIHIDSFSLGSLHIPTVCTAASASEAGVADVVLVCVKTHQTAAILDDLGRLLQPSTTILTMQNGVESDDLIADRYGRQRVLPSVVIVGATTDRPGHVQHVAAGTIVLGATVEESRERAEGLRALLSKTGLPVRVSEDIRYERWRKLAWNVGFNMVSAVTGREPAVLLRVPESRELLTNVMQEVVAVARAQGIGLTDADAEEQIAWTERQGAIRTSTMVDRERGRAMEIDGLIGVVVRRGRQHGVATPCCATLLALLRAIESS